MVELAEDFREDFDGQIEQVELGGHHLFFGNSNARYESLLRLFPASMNDTSFVPVHLPFSATTINAATLSRPT